MGATDINNELENFESDLISSRNKLKLLLDDIEKNEYEYGDLKLIDFLPIYSKRSVHIVDTRKSKSNNDNNLF